MRCDAVWDVRANDEDGEKIEFTLDNFQFIEVYIVQIIAGQRYSSVQ